MPQISPINWTILILIFLLILMTMKTSFQQITPTQTNPCKKTTAKKSLKW